MGGVTITLTIYFFGGTSILLVVKNVRNRNLY